MDFVIDNNCKLHIKPLEKIVFLKAGGKLKEDEEINNAINKALPEGHTAEAIVKIHLYNIRAEG